MADGERNTQHEEAARLLREAEESLEDHSSPRIDRVSQRIDAVWDMLAGLVRTIDENRETQAAANTIMESTVHGHGQRLDTIGATVGELATTVRELKVVYAEVGNFVTDQLAPMKRRLTVLESGPAVQNPITERRVALLEKGLAEVVKALRLAGPTLWPRTTPDPGSEPLARDEDTRDPRLAHLRAADPAPVARSFEGTRRGIHCVTCGRDFWRPVLSRSGGTELAPRRDDCFCVHCGCRP